MTGGTDGSRMLASAERYDPRSVLCVSVGDMTTPRSAHAATLLADGRVLIACGSSARDTVVSGADIDDSASGRFAVTGAMTVVRHKHAAAAVRRPRPRCRWSGCA